MCKQHVTSYWYLVAMKMQFPLDWAWAMWQGCTCIRQMHDYQDVVEELLEDGSLLRSFLGGSLGSCVHIFHASVPILSACSLPQGTLSDGYILSRDANLVF